MNEMVNLTSEQLGESKDRPEMQMDYTGMEKVFDSSGCGRKKVLTLRQVTLSSD